MNVVIAGKVSLLLITKNTMTTLQHDAVKYAMHRAVFYTMEGIQRLFFTR